MNTPRNTEVNKLSLDLDSSTIVEEKDEFNTRSHSRLVHKDSIEVSTSCELRKKSGAEIDDTFKGCGGNTTDAREP